jgi:ATP-dependent DNA helicase RecQ
MYRLAEAPGCRHERLVGHFGERIAACGDACDRCAGDDVLARAPAARGPGRGSSPPPRRGRRPAAPDGGPIDVADPAGAAELFERLRAWRARTATARGVPAFVVFADATLAAIAAARPRDEDGLLAVKGVGPRKLAEHGADVLAIVRGPAAD